MRIYVRRLPLALPDGTHGDGLSGQGHRAEDDSNHCGDAFEIRVRFPGPTEVASLDVTVGIRDSRLRFIKADGAFDIDAHDCSSSRTRTDPAHIECEFDEPAVGAHPHRHAQVPGLGPDPPIAACSRSISAVPRSATRAARSCSQMRPSASTTSRTVTSIRTGAATEPSNSATGR